MFVHLDRLHVVRRLDDGSGNDGEYRVFVNVGNTWTMANELITGPTLVGPVGPANVLENGLGDTGDDQWFSIDHSIPVTVRRRDTSGSPSGPTTIAYPPDFYIQAGGWESDTTDESFGYLLDPYSPCTEAFKNGLANKVFDPWSNVFGGCNNNDPIGELVAGYSSSAPLGREIVVAPTLHPQ